MEKEKQQLIDIVSSFTVKQEQEKIQEQELLNKAKNQANQKIHELNLEFESQQKEWETASKEAILSFEKEMK